MDRMDFLHRSLLVFQQPARWLSVTSQGKFVGWSLDTSLPRSGTLTLAPSFKAEVSRQQFTSLASATSESSAEKMFIVFNPMLPQELQILRQGIIQSSLTRRGCF